MHVVLCKQTAGHRGWPGRSRESKMEEVTATEGESDEIVVDEVIDLEEYAKAGKRPPRARVYKIKINDDPYEWPTPFITGREVLDLAKAAPADQYTVRVKMAGEKPRKVGLDEKVDLRAPGVEKFRVIRKDQTDGEKPQERRDAPLLDVDGVFLESYGLRFDVVQEGHIWIILRNFSLPTGFNVPKADAAIRVEQGYPFTALDMVYFFPALSRLDGKAIPQSDVRQALEGRQYQRWSRHRTGDNPWVPNRDSVETHVYLIEEWVEMEIVR